MKKVGLALGVGGFRGGVHIGVIKTLLKHNIPIDYIAGTSAGAIIGGIYALTKDINITEQAYKNFKATNYASLFLDISFITGLIKGTKFEDYLNKYTLNKNIQYTKTPFVAIATDITTSNKVEIKSGNLAKAIQHSGNVPVLFESKVDENVYLADGGLSSPLAIETVKNMGADVVIAVDTLSGMFPLNEKEIKTLDGTKMIFISMHTFLSRISKYQAKEADVLIQPQTPWSNAGMLSKNVSSDLIIQDGIDATEKSIAKIKELIETKGFFNRFVKK